MSESEGDVDDVVGVELERAGKVVAESRPDDVGEWRGASTSQ